MQQQRVIPALPMTDYNRSKAFYVDGLGFHIDREHRFEPGFPVFAHLSRDGMIIYLTEHAGDCKAGGLVHFEVDNVDAWYIEFSCNGVKVSVPPNEDLPHLRMMTVVDPDGNQLRFFREPGHHAIRRSTSSRSTHLSPSREVGEVNWQERTTAIMAAHGSVSRPRLIGLRSSIAPPAPRFGKPLSRIR